MSPRISFEFQLQYRDLEGLAGVFPAIPIGLVGPNGADDLVAIVDSGAAYSLFDGRRASAIGLDLQAGKRISLTGVSGQITAWIHLVTLEICGATFPCEVAFSEAELNRELLGRHDLFPRARIAFREGLSEFYFHPKP